MNDAFFVRCFQGLCDLPCNGERVFRASRAPGQPFREARTFEKAYLIQLFQEMLEAGVHFTPVETHGGYLEIDTQQDYDLARRFWR